MAVIPPTGFKNLESPVKPPMEIFNIPYPDLYDPDEEIIKYPLSSTTNTNSSIAEVRSSTVEFLFSTGMFIWRLFKIWFSIWKQTLIDHFRSQNFLGVICYFQRGDQSIEIEYRKVQLYYN